MARCPFAFDLSILMLLFVILGGLGTVWGPLIGTAVLLIIPELIAGFIEGRRRERSRDAHLRINSPFSSNSHPLCADLSTECSRRWFRSGAGVP